MKITASGKPVASYNGQLLVQFASQQENDAVHCCSESIDAAVQRAAKLGDFSGKEGETLLLYPGCETESKKTGPQRLLIVGLGKEPFNGELFRRVGGTVINAAQKTRANEIMVVVPSTDSSKPSATAECLCEGMILANYRFKKYKTTDKDEDKPVLIDHIRLHFHKTAPLKNAIRNGCIAAGAANLAKDMANEPANYWVPESFAKTSRELAKKYGFTHNVLEIKALRKLAMGGLLGVNQGSAQPPKLIILQYIANPDNPTLLLVGKGLTFDSGGISLKPGKGMEDMKYDMCGGAAVLATMAAVGQEQPKKINITAVIPATENLPGPKALKPGDVITQYGGKTVEVINTDAEGRLILADALAYGIEQFKPQWVIDLATLTGAVIIGLGHHRSGLMSNDDAFAKEIIAAGEKAGEPLWQLPLGKEYTKQLKSEIADLKNIGSPPTAGTITAACFLQEFVGDTKWVHLDIAGTAWNYTEKPYISKGPSGIGVRTLLEFIRTF